MTKKVILKISGEALSKGDGNIISMEKVNDVAKEIKELYDQGSIQIGIISGAGNVWRGRDAIEHGMSRVDADYMGMIGTVLNCIALKNALCNLGVKAVVLSSITMPQIVETYSRDRALRFLEEKYVCIFAGGIANPYFTTDTTAAMRASELGADMILMAKNGTDGVYDKDPRKFKDAKKYKTLSHKEVLDKELGVMDLSAALLCMQNNIDIVVFDMNVKGNIAASVINPGIGTYITNK